MTELWARIDAQDWDGVAGLLDPDVRVEFAHTAEVFDRAGWVAFNRDYPGTWRGRVLDVVSSGDREVSRAAVTDGAEVFHVASFARVRAGLITELVEVWSAAEAPAGPRSGG